MFNSFYFDNYDLITDEPVSDVPTTSTEEESERTSVRPQSSTKFMHSNFMSSPKKFYALYKELNLNSKLVARGSNYVVKSVDGSQVRLRYMWDIDTGEIYKYQVLVPAGGEILMVFEHSALDNDIVIAYTDSERMYYGA